MSFTAIYRAGNGLAAIADSKSTLYDSTGKPEWDQNRNPDKLFTFPGGVAVTYGANQILVQNPSERFPRHEYIEEIVYSYLRKGRGLDADFFQTLLLKLSSDPANRTPLYFLLGRKIWDGKYRMERHKIGYQYYGERIIPDHVHYVLGGEEVYCHAFEEAQGLKHIQDADFLRRLLVRKLSDCIQQFDKSLPYNSVGGMIKSCTLI